MSDPKRVRPLQERTVHATGRDESELTVAYLGELLSLQDTEGFLARRIQVRATGRPAAALTARLMGEPFDPARHLARTEVKAITYHRLVFDPRRGTARVIVDI